jgi:hypothetical protein
MDDLNLPPSQPQDQLEPDPSENEEVVEAPEEPQEPTFTWQASEYVHHHKGAGWYVGLAIVVGLLIIVAILFKFWLSIGVFLAMGAAIAVYAQKPPRVLTYELDSDSVTIEGKAYPYKNFRSFGVISDIEWHTIDLEPTQRFMPRLTVLFSDDDFDSIVDHLSAHLPRADRQPDVIERLTRYLRF